MPDLPETPAPENAPAPENTAQAEAPTAPEAAPVVLTPINIGEDFGSKEGSIPRAALAVIVFVALGILAVIFGSLLRAKPPGSGTITKVVVAEQAPNVIVAVQVRFQNYSDSTVTIKTIRAELVSADGTKNSDTAAPASMLERYYQTFPSLRPDELDIATPLKEEMKVPAKGSQIGVAVFAFPVTKAAFDVRQSLTVKIDFYERPAPMELK